LESRRIVAASSELIAGIVRSFSHSNRDLKAGFSEYSNN
jgi:hypothetical protein